MPYYLDSVGSTVTNDGQDNEMVQVNFSDENGQHNIRYEGLTEDQADALYAALRDNVGRWRDGPFPWPMPDHEDHPRYPTPYPWPGFNEIGALSFRDAYFDSAGAGAFNLLPIGHDLGSQFSLSNLAGMDLVF